MGSRQKRDGVIIAIGKIHTWDLPGGPVVKTALPMQGAWVKSLVREPRSQICMAQPLNKLNNSKNNKIVLFLKRKKKKKNSLSIIRLEAVSGAPALPLPPPYLPQTLSPLLSLPASVTPLYLPQQFTLSAEPFLSVLDQNPSQLSHTIPKAPWSPATHECRCKNLAFAVR